MSRRLHFALAAAVISGLALLSASGAAQLAPQTAPRDTPAQPREAAKGSARIAGRILTADNGRPISRALVRLTTADLPGGRATLTDNGGAFEITDLPAGRYVLAASKSGYVGMSYGQRRPRQAGTPLQLSDGQALKDIEMRLPRGSAVGGHVYDEIGDPLPGAAVRVMQYVYAQGSRQLVPAGTAQTDDRGEYRVWGLNPGEYYVTATARNPTIGIAGGGPAAIAGRAGPGVFARGGFGGPGGPDDPEQEGYAPTYYPGVPSVQEARLVSVGLSAEAVGIDFSVLLVRTSRIAGRVISTDGSPATGGNVTLIPEGLARLPGATYGSRIQRDGAFSIVNVPPGRYVLRARGEGVASITGDGDPARLFPGLAGRGRGGEFVPPQFGSLPLTVDGNITDLNVSLVPGATISGSVTFNGSQSPDSPQVSQFRIQAALLEAGDMGPPSTARIEPDGTFLLVGVPAGTLWLRAQGSGGWTLTSVLLDSRETIDAPFEVRGGEKITGVSLQFSDRQSEISGTVTDEQGAPITEYTVLAFPTDSALWRPQARQIKTARPDQFGKFQLRGLPPGDYYLATIDPAEPGEWFEPAFLDEQRAGAARLRIGEGDVKTQDFKISTR